MIPKGAVSLANVLVDNVTLDESLVRLESFVSSKQSHLIVTPNPEMIVACQDDKELLNIINTADLRLPDGISMVVVSNILGKPLKERVTGIDFLIASCKLAAEKNWKIFLIGSTQEVIEKAAANLKIQFPKLNIVGIHNGYFKDGDNQEKEILSRIQTLKPDLVFAGLGAGRQEKWLKRNLKGVGIGVGGSFDVISGLKKRAPVWIQKLYIEWLYRLITEPQRWKRQLALPKFLYLTLIKCRLYRRFLWI